MFPQRLTSRAGSWLTLVLGLLLTVGMIGALRGAQQPPSVDAVPAVRESARSADRLANMPGHDVQPVLLVITRDDGGRLSPIDLSPVTALAGRLPVPEGHRASRAVPSQDRAAALVQVPIRVDASSNVNAATVTDLRERISQATPAGQRVASPEISRDRAKW